MHLGTPINSPTRKSPSLEERITDLQKEMLRMQEECSMLLGLDPQAVADCMTRADRRVTMLRYGINLVRSEAKVLARAQRPVSEGKATSYGF